LKYDITIYGNPALRKKCRKIKTITAEVRQLAVDMLETMYAGNGIGLAAQQVGRTEALVVLDIPLMTGSGEVRPVESEPAVKMPVVLINPVIVESEGSATCEEGCLSFPGFYVPVKRAETVRATFLDLDGVAHDIRVNGLFARAIQHELDHLNGKLLVDRMAAERKLELADDLKRLRESGLQQAEATAS